MDESQFLEKLKESPQKYEDFATISYQMKYDIFNTFRDKNYTCLELGCNKGYTTNILSSVFKEVIGIDFNDDYLKIAQKLNQKNSNTSFIKMDLYNPTEWMPLEKFKIDVALIDTDKNLELYKRDIINCIQIKTKYIICNNIFIDENSKKNKNDTEKVISGILKQYNNEIKSIKYVGIDWYHYKVPVLQLPIFCFQIDESNIGLKTGVEFNWFLRDQTDVKLNKNNIYRPFYKNMSLNINVFDGYFEFINGCKKEWIKHNMIGYITRGISNIDGFQISNQTFSNEIIYQTLLPLKANKFNPKTISSCMADTSLFSYGDHNYEGMIIEFNCL